MPKSRRFQDGFDIAHPIGLFDLADNLLLTSGTMSAGVGDPLIDEFRYIDTPDIGLTAGRTYVISYYSATDNNDLVITMFATFDVNRAITYVQGRWGKSTGLAIPSNGTSCTRIGPNFQFVPAPPVQPCPWDLNGDGIVNVLDLITLLISFGPCEDCPADFDDDGFVNVLDLITLIMNFGPCPGTPCVWDVNGDGVVNGSDVQAVATHFGPCP